MKVINVSFRRFGLPVQFKPQTRPLPPRHLRQPHDLNPILYLILIMYGDKRHLIAIPSQTLGLTVKDTII
jgi:hypothetical protein